MTAPENQEQPVIVKKVNKGGGHHGGAWKVAYADFVTAMMALFIVLWILNSSDDVKQAVAGYFKDPVGFTSGGSGSPININSGIPMPDEKILREKEFKETQRKKFEKMREEIIEQISKNHGLSSLVDQVKFEFTDEGLRIEMIDSTNEVFFKLSSARLNPEASTILEKVGGEIGKLNNKVAIEGHTDIRPFNSGSLEYTNYELSTDRANTARRSLIRGGLNESQIDEVRGYAANRLRNVKDPFSVVNRRISIIIKYENGI